MPLLLIICTICSILLLSEPIFFGLSSTSTVAAATNTIPTAEVETKIPIYMISTRGNTTYHQEVNRSGYNNNYIFSNLTSLFELCPSEVAIFIHGWGNDEGLAKERLDRVKLALKKTITHILLLVSVGLQTSYGRPQRQLPKKMDPSLLI